MVQYLRAYESSVINYIKYEVLPVYFTETMTGVPLNYSATKGGYIPDVSNLPEPHPFSRGRGFSVFDEYTVNGKKIVDTTQEQTSQISVVGASSYSVDYKDGVIRTAESPTEIDFSWYYVSVVEGWPGSEPPQLPAVAIEIIESDKEPYQLGGGSKDVLEGVVYIFATSKAEKNDITDAVYQSLYGKSLTIRNWDEGSYLDFDGTYSGFDPEPVAGVSTGLFTSVKSVFSSPSFNWSEVNRYRSKVTFTLEVYK